MRRLRAAAAPAAFFVGLGLVCASFIQLQRWPWLERRLAGSDLQEDLLGGWFPELERFASPPSIEAVVSAGLIATGVAAFIGFALIALEKRVAGGFGLIGGISLGAVLLSLAGCDLRLLDRLGHGCGPGVPLHSPAILSDAGLFLAWAVALAAAAWIVMQYQAGVPLRPAAITAAGLALCMVGLTLLYARAALADEARLASAPPSAWPLAPVAMLTLAGVLLSCLRPLYCSRLVSALILVAGLASMVPAVAIAHDEAVERHEGYSPIATFEPTSCGVPQPTNELTVTAHEVYSDSYKVSGDGSSAIEEGVSTRLFKSRSNFLYINERGGLDVPPMDWINLFADRAAPMAAIAGVSRAAVRAKFRFIDVISFRRSPNPLWTRPSTHDHPCAVRIELSEAGVPLSEFADWPSLARAADEAKGTLRINVAR